MTAQPIEEHVPANQTLAHQVATTSTDGISRIRNEYTRRAVAHMSAHRADGGRTAYEYALAALDKQARLLPGGRDLVPMPRPELGAPLMPVCLWEVQ